MYRRNGYLFFTHFGELVKESEVLGEMFAVRLYSVFHDRQQRFDESSHTGATADVFHRPVHVIRAKQQNT